MDNSLTMVINYRTLTWRSNKFHFCGTLITKPSKTPKLLTSISSSLRPPPPSHLHSRHHHPSGASPRRSSTKRTTLLVETYHQKQRLKSLLGKISKRDSDPPEILRDDGDWSKDEFWAVVRLLVEASRSKEVIQVFDLWKSIEHSRINEFNYEKIIELLSGKGLMEEAVSALREMKGHGLCPSVEIYNGVIRGFARKGKFDGASFFLNEMREIDLVPDTETYDGLIEAYGKYRMYDEIGFCLKKMESNGCFPDQITYNLLIREFSQGGLLERMERVYRTLRSKQMNLQPSTLIAMLEAYANVGLVEKMEKVYGRVLNSGAPLNDNLIRKLARVYIENYMFSRLDDLGLDLLSCYDKADLAWCLRLLSHACLLSKKGMESIVAEMGEAKVSWNITIANIILLAHLKMKDFTQLTTLISGLQARRVKPDIVTVGILCDANNAGFDGIMVLNMWRRMKFLNEAVEMKTDPLVLTAFGKGHFLKSCEEMYSSLETKARENKMWTYQTLLNFVLKHNGRAVFDYL